MGSARVLCIPALRNLPFKDPFLGIVLIYRIFSFSASVFLLYRKNSLVESPNKVSGV